MYLVQFFVGNSTGINAISLYFVKEMRLQEVYYSFFVAYIQNLAPLITVTNKPSPKK